MSAGHTTRLTYGPTECLVILDEPDDVCCIVVLILTPVFCCFSLNVDDVCGVGAAALYLTLKHEGQMSDMFPCWYPMTISVLSI